MRYDSRMVRKTALPRKSPICVTSDMERRLGWQSQHRYLEKSWDCHPSLLGYKRPSAHTFRYRVSLDQTVPVLWLEHGLRKNGNADNEANLRNHHHAPTALEKIDNDKRNTQGERSQENTFVETALFDFVNANVVIRVDENDGQQNG